MSAAVTLLATAAATVGAVRAVRLVKRRMADAERRVARLRARQDARREAPVLDLEAGADGVYGVARPARLEAERDRS